MKQYLVVICIDDPGIDPKNPVRKSAILNFLFESTLAIPALPLDELLDVVKKNYLQLKLYDYCFLDRIIEKGMITNIQMVEVKGATPKNFVMQNGEGNIYLYKKPTYTPLG